MFGTPSISMADTLNRIIQFLLLPKISHLTSSSVSLGASATMYINVANYIDILVN